MRSPWIGLWAIALLAGCGGGAPTVEAQSTDAAALPQLQASNAPAPRTPDSALTKAFTQQIAKSLRKASKKTDGDVQPADVRVGVHVRELGVPGEVVRIDGERPMRPASNMKLVTTSAALVLLGSEATFETRAEGRLTGATIEGDLILRAGGDPLYGAVQSSPETGRSFGEGHLDAWARSLTALGLRHVSGNLVLDEGSFVDPAPGPAWPSDDQHWRDYCALSGGFSINGGCVTALIEATAKGQAARVKLIPAHHGLQPKVGVTTVAKRKPLDVRVGAPGTNLIVRGTIPADVPEYRSDFAAPDPVELFGSAWRAALEQAGVQVAGTLVRERGASPAPHLATFESPIRQVLSPINAESNNPVADQLFLATALRVRGEATRAAGAQATAQALEQLGVPADGLVQVDGSGLSYDNLVAPVQMTALLDGVLGYDPVTAELFLASLAVAGKKGTLEGRMRGTPAEGRVFGKTGWIRGTSCLSGLVRSTSGRSYVFCILIEYPVVGGLNNSVWKPLQDKLCALLAVADA